MQEANSGLSKEIWGKKEMERVRSNRRAFLWAIPATIVAAVFFSTWSGALPALFLLR